MTKSPLPPKTLIAANKKARHNYFIEETIEAGLVLYGSEVKSLRAGKANIADGYVHEKAGELYLLGCHIAEYTQANRFNHPPTRPRKLLLHKQELNKLMGKVKIKGYTLVPLSLYFNHKNIAKAELGLAKGKKQHDKRETEKQRDWQRQKARVMKEQ